MCFLGIFFNSINRVMRISMVRLMKTFCLLLVCIVVCNSCSTKYYSEPLVFDVTIIPDDDSKKNIYDVCSNPDMEPLEEIIKGKSVAVVCSSQNKIRLRMDQNFADNIVQTLKNDHFSVVNNLEKADVILSVSGFEAVKKSEKILGNDKNQRIVYFHEYKATVDIYFRDSSKQTRYVYTRPVVSEFLALENINLHNLYFKENANVINSNKIKEKLKELLQYFASEEKEKLRFVASKDCFCVLYGDDYFVLKSGVDIQDKNAPEQVIDIMRVLKSKNVCMEKYPDKADIILLVGSCSKKVVGDRSDAICRTRSYEVSQKIDIIDRGSEVKLSGEMKKKVDVMEKEVLIKKGNWRKERND